MNILQENESVSTSSELKDIRSQMVQWLEFAEKKNGALVAACGVSVWGILRLQPSELVLSNTFCWGIGFMFMGIFLSLLSFFPKLNRMQFFFTKDIKSTDNLYYFGDIRKYGSKQYLDKMEPVLNPEESRNHNEMIANQIINLAEIAHSKYMYFRLSLLLAIIGVGLIVTDYFLR